VAERDQTHEPDFKDIDSPLLLATPDLFSRSQDKKIDTSERIYGLYQGKPTVAREEK
jgi:hypothetical protein